MTAAWILTFWLFAVGWFCCNCDVLTDACAFCTDSDAAVSVTFSGIVDAGCGRCDELNGTHIIDRFVADGCLWGIEYFAGQPCSTHRIVLTAGDLPTAGTNAGWKLEFNVNRNTGPNQRDTAVHIWDSGGSGAFDCTANHTLTEYTTTPAADPTCDLSGLVCEVN
jgi:hypothetical protein